MKPCKHLTYPACGCKAENPSPPKLLSVLSKPVASHPTTSEVKTKPEPQIAQDRKKREYRVVPLYADPDVYGLDWVDVLGYNLAFTSLIRRGLV